MYWYYKLFIIIDDDSKVVSDMFDLDEKRRIRKEIFPKDCDKAFDMGARFVKEYSKSEV